MINIKLSVSNVLSPYLPTGSQIHITGFGSKFADLSIRVSNHFSHPNEISEMLSHCDVIDAVDFINGFYNISLKENFFTSLSLKEDDLLNDDSIVVEFFSPNIYTNIDIRILRNIYIGYAIARVLKKQFNNVMSNAVVTNQGVKNNTYYTLYSLYPEKSIQELRVLLESQDEGIKDTLSKIETGEMNIEEPLCLQTFTQKAIESLDSRTKEFGVTIDSFVPFSDLEHLQEEVISKLEHLGFKDSIKFNNGKTKQIFSSNGTPTYLIKDVAAILYRERHGVTRVCLVLAEDQKSHVKYLTELVNMLSINIEIVPIIHTYAKTEEDYELDELYDKLAIDKKYNSFDDFCDDLKLFSLSVDENKTLIITYEKLKSFKLLYNISRLKAHHENKHSESGLFCDKAKEISMASLDVLSRFYAAQKSLVPSQMVQAMLKYTDSVLHVYESISVDHIFDNKSASFVGMVLDKFYKTLDLQEA